MECGAMEDNKRQHSHFNIVRTSGFFPPNALIVRVSIGRSGLHKLTNTELQYCFTFLIHGTRVSRCLTSATMAFDCSFSFANVRILMCGTSTSSMARKAHEDIVFPARRAARMITARLHVSVPAMRMMVAACEFQYLAKIKCRDALRNAAQICCCETNMSRKNHSHVQIRSMRARTISSTGPLLDPLAYEVTILSRYRLPVLKEPSGGGTEKKNGLKRLEARRPCSGARYGKRLAWCLLDADAMSPGSFGILGAPSSWSSLSLRTRSLLACSIFRRCASLASVVSSMITGRPVSASIAGVERSMSPVRDGSSIIGLVKPFMAFIDAMRACIADNILRLSINEPDTPWAVRGA